MPYTLENGEGILQQIDTVWVSGDLDIQGSKVLLTSRYVVFIEQIESQGEEIVRLPISSIRVFENCPQVFITGSSLDPRLDIYFDTMNISLSFTSIIRPSKRREVYQKWVNSISLLLRGITSNCAMLTHLPKENSRPHNPNDAISFTEVSRNESIAPVRSSLTDDHSVNNNVSSQEKLCDGLTKHLHSIEAVPNGVPSVVNQIPFSDRDNSTHVAEKRIVERKVEFEGNIRKCPNCGNLVKSFLPVCDFCGHEFRNTNNSMMVEEFEQKYQSAKSDKQRIILIQAFSVPNTKEDVLEMFSLAAANVCKSDVKNKELDLAWQSKLEQVYLKIGIILRDDPGIARIDQLYKEKIRDIRKWKRYIFLMEYGYLIPLILAPVIVFVMGIIAMISGVD